MCSKNTSHTMIRYYLDEDTMNTRLTLMSNHYEGAMSGMYVWSVFLPLPVLWPATRFRATDIDQDGQPIQVADVFTGTFVFFTTHRVNQWFRIQLNRVDVSQSVWEKAHPSVRMACDFQLEQISWRNFTHNSWGWFSVTFTATWDYHHRTIKSKTNIQINRL